MIIIANRYWVGNGGNTSDAANHWSSSSNGSPGASAPTSADSVYFDQYSITSAGQIITFDGALNCLDIDTTGVLNSPSFKIDNALSVYGNLKFIGITTTGTSLIYFKATSIGKTVTTNGINLSASVYFDGVGGEWTLQDNVTVLYSLTIRNGSFISNNKNITCQDFTSALTNARAVNLGSSVITTTGSVLFSSTGLTFPDNTATIKMSGTPKTFTGAGLSHGNLECIGSSITVADSNTFKNLKTNPGKTLKLTSGTNQTVSSLTAQGTVGNLINIQSVTASSPATITCASGTILAEYCNITDVNATGGATFRYDATCTLLRSTGWITGATQYDGTITRTIDGGQKITMSGGTNEYYSYQYQDIAITAGTVIDSISIKGKVSGNVTGKFMIEWFNGSTSISTDMVTEFTNTDYTTILGTNKIAPVGTTKIRLWIMYKVTSGGSGSIWFTDASVRKAITSVSAYVQQLNDQSGNGNHAVQNTQANQPSVMNNGIWKVDSSGKISMYFGISNTCCLNVSASSSINMTTQYTLNVVAKGGGSTGRFIDKNNINDYALRGNGGTNSYTVHAGVTSLNGTNDSYSNVVYQIIIATFNSALASSNMKLYINGVAKGSANNTTAITATNTGLTLGNRSIDPRDRYLENGYLSEIIIFSLQLTDAQRIKLEKDQSKRYQIALT